VQIQKEMTNIKKYWRILSDFHRRYAKSIMNILYMETDKEHIHYTMSILQRKN